jgi:thioredoxin-like negative regulator of GroEL
MAEVVYVQNPSEFEAVYQQVTSEQEFVILVFTGGDDPATGASWCPDCIVHKPAITEKIINQSTGKVIIALVPTRSEWVGNSEHPYKKHQVFKVRGVPTVLLVRDNQVLTRAENDADFENDDLLAMIAKPE